MTNLSNIPCSSHFAHNNNPVRWVELRESDRPKNTQLAFLWLRWDSNSCSPISGLNVRQLYLPQAFFNDYFKNKYCVFEIKDRSHVAYPFAGEKQHVSYSQDISPQTLICSNTGNKEGWWEL